MIPHRAFWKFTVPELPEAETVARTLFPHIHQCVFKSAQLLRESSLHSLSLPLSSLINLRIANVRRRAKLIVLDLEGGEGPLAPDCLIVHLRMTGRIFTADANREQGRHCRCVFGLENPQGGMFQLFFDDTRAFGKLMCATPAILESWKFWRELGPEPLEIGPEIFLRRLKGRRPIKVALLDQTVIAGIGNIYADEALFRAGINPGRPAESLSEAEGARLLTSLQDVLRLSISQCGSSIRDYRDADGNVGSFQNSFAVYGRGGQGCRNCGAPLQKTRIGGRATVYCGRCQS